MDNFFDQFDSPNTVKHRQIAPTTANFFDQFDQVGGPVPGRQTQGPPGSGGRPPPRPDPQKLPGSFLGESAEGLREIPHDLYEGARETIEGAQERYQQGASEINRDDRNVFTGPLRRVIGAPLSGLYNVVAGSPAGQAAMDVGMSGYLPPGTRGLEHEPIRSMERDLPAVERAGVAGKVDRAPVAAPAPDRTGKSRFQSIREVAEPTGRQTPDDALGARLPKQPPSASIRQMTTEEMRQGQGTATEAARPAYPPKSVDSPAVSKAHAEALGDALTPKPFSGSLGATKTTQSTAATIKPGKGIWGKPTAGRNVIRQQIGIKAHDTARQDQAMEQFRRLSNEATVQENIDTIRYMQHRSAEGPLGSVTLVNPKFQGVADEIRRGYRAREAHLKALDDEFTRMQFEEDHFTQKWQDPRKAKDVWDGWVKREGDKGFTKHKKYLDFDAGLAAGLTPKSYNILDVAMNDFSNIDRVIAMARVREIAEDQGYLKWADSPRSVPSDWVQLKGYGADRWSVRAYAPADFARNYNNFVGRGWNETSMSGTVHGLRAGINGLTQLELTLSAYHAMTISREALATGIADTVYELAHGRPLQAGKNIGKAFSAPFYYGMKGRKAGQIYLGLTPGSPTEARAIEALTQVNAHLGELEPALLSGKTRSLWTQYQRGAIVKDIQNSVRHVWEAEGRYGLNKFGTGVVEASRAAGDVLNTITAPLFQHYIPAVKRGMMMDQMSAWLKTHPSASWDETLAQAERVSDIADERFGEMRQDNLFWDPLIKQTAQLAMRSTSWAYGTWTQYVGGLKEIGSIPRQGLGRRTSYLFGDFFTTALIGAITTRLMTGKNPDDWRDYVWPRTGGTTTVHAGARTYKVDERVNLPAPMKEIIGITAAIMDAKEYGSLSGFADYARNKENDLIRTMMEVVTNQDWRGAPVLNPFSKDSLAKQWFNEGLKGFSPISLKQEEPDAGSKLKFPGSAFIGIRPTGRRWIDPEGYKQGVDAKLQKSAKEEESYQRRRAGDRVRHEEARP